MLRLLCGALTAVVITSSPAAAQEVKITPETASATIEINGEVIQIERIQDTSHQLTSEFTKTSRPCPPFCISPIAAAPGVSTVGEIEVISFLENEVAGGKGLLIDSRVPEWFAKGTIPGAVNVPFAALEETNPYRNEILKALGATESGGVWNFDNAMNLTLFCNGPWCDQSPRSIRSLLSAGYPADKVNYYRGGMQLWLLLGLTVKSPNA